jgi:hypothetical protein
VHFGCVGPLLSSTGKPRDKAALSSVFVNSMILAVSLAIYCDLFPKQSNLHCLKEYSKSAVRMGSESGARTGWPNHPRRIMQFKVAALHNCTLLTNSIYLHKE